jgi:hypothetical protein
MIVIAILAIYGLAFLIKQSDGPFGIINWMRNRLISNKFVGVFFYHLLDCWFCTGCHCGWIVYLLYSKEYSWQFFTLWTLAGGAISLILDGVRERLLRE